MNLVSYINKESMSREHRHIAKWFDEYEDYIEVQEIILPRRNGKSEMMRQMLERSIERLQTYRELYTNERERELERQRRRNHAAIGRGSGSRRIYWFGDYL